jgi:hypothetical protein
MKSPEEMTAGEINRQLEKVDAEISKLNSEMIAAGYGHVKYWDTEKEAPKFWPRFKALHDRRQALRTEIELRYGPGAPSKLPRGFGPRKRNPIRKVSGGYQWGHHGHVYPTRAGAERQAAAAHANGFRERNPMSEKLPSLVKDAVARVKSGETLDQAANWVWFQSPSSERKKVDAWIVETKHSLGFEPGTAEQRFKALVREHMRDKNPGRKRVHTAKWDRCVKEVRQRGTAADPYAVCTAAMGELAIRKPHRRGARASNPLPRLTSVRKIYYAVTAKKGRERLYLKRNGKLTRKEPDAARFSSVAEAMARARAHLARYPTSRSYQFDVGLAY